MDFFKKHKNIEIKSPVEPTEGSDNEISEHKKKMAIQLSKKLEKGYSKKNVQKIEKKKESYINKGALGKIWDKIEFLWKKMLEKGTPTNVKIAIFGGFAYMILPIDIIPDVLPGLGLVDDAAVFLYVFKTVAPYFKELSKDIVDQIASEKIKVILQDTYKRTIFKAILVFLINLAGTLIVCFEPFGKIASTHIASVLFIGAFVFSIIQCVIFIKNYGLITYNVSISIIKKRSIRQGIASFVRSEDEKVFKIVTNVFKFFDVVNKMSDIDLPSMEDVIHHFVKKFLGNILLFFGLYSLYVVGVYWLLKPILLHQFAQLNLWQIMIFPFWQLGNTLISAF